MAKNKRKAKSQRRLRKQQAKKKKNNVPAVGESGKVAPEYQLACPITSYSHRLNSNALKLLQSGNAFIGVSDVTEHSFFARVMNLQKTDSLDKFMATAQQSVSYLLMVFNLGTLGHFIWSRNEQDIYPQFSIVDPTDNTAIKMLKHSPNKMFPVEELRDLTEEELRRTALLFIAIAKDPIKQVAQEYLKGVYHLSLEIFEMRFDREAFANFYRSLEFFITDRVLKVRKLDNEVQDIKRGIREIGLGEVLAEEFEDLYRTRSEQVMHAQREQVNLDRDSVLKMKMIADAVMNKVYEPIWRDEMNREPD